MREIKATDFESRCLALMDEVASTGEPLLITRDGKPVAELRPHIEGGKSEAYGIWKGRISIKGDIIAPLDEEWDALK